MIERQKTKYGWEFLFLGANIDAVETASQFGIGEDRAVNYRCAVSYTHLYATLLHWYEQDKDKLTHKGLNKKMNYDVGE